VSLTATSVAVPGIAFAEESATEAQTEAEAETEAETEVELEHPDYTALDYVTLGEYKGLTVTRTPLEVTDEEIDEEIRYDVELADALEVIEEGEVQEGDIANIDFEGKKDGEAFDGGTSEGYDLEIGSGSFIDGFEDGLIGVAVGETVDLDLTFPEYYGNEELAGQDVVFTVTVNSIQRMPELTDELVSTITDGEYTDVASYRDSVGEELMAEKQENAEDEIQSELLTLIANTSTINDYPQELLDYGAQTMTNYYKQYAELYGMEFADFLETFFGMTEDDFAAEVDVAVKESVQQEMFLQAIAETEGLDISDAEYAEGCENYAEMYGYESGDAFAEAYSEKIIRLSLLQDKVFDLIRDNAIITEEAETEVESETAAE
jgi:trigger factor